MALGILFQLLFILPSYLKKSVAAHKKAEVN